MDKIGPALAWTKKNLFWLGCGFFSILMIAMWFVTTGAIDAETKKSTSAITSSVSTGQGILKKSAEDEVVAHPNDSTKEGMKVEMEATINAIVAAWKKRESDQKELLVWPSVITSDKFVRVFARYNPPETFPKDLPALGDFEALLGFYGREIPKHMEYLCSEELLDANWMFGEKEE